MSDKIPLFTAVASVDQLRQGETLKVHVGNYTILLANVEGKIYAVDDTCTHEDSSLALGCLKGELVTCTLHGSRFNVRTGMPLEEPADKPLNTYPVKVENGSILIKLAQN